MSTLYIVATPIGNLEDVTFRAISTLREVDLILSEDTRVTRRLLQRYEIKTPTESLNARTEGRKAGRVVELLQAGKSLALVSDAGTPAISDPGAILVSMIRAALPEIKIEPIPGASALTAALSVAGLPASDFLFLGFLPHKKGRETLFAEIVESKRVVVLYESPHRVVRTLGRLTELLDETRQVIALRELTKIFEEVVRGSPAEVLASFAVRDSIKGEFVLMISGAK